MPLPQGVRAVLLDIEGTTTPITFVYDVLFPFARSRLDSACAKGEKPFAEAVSLLKKEYDEEPREGLPAFGSGAPYAHFLMDRDRKSTGLKALQGLIWEEGYRSGALEGEVFEDVPAALEAWHAAGIRLRIFSSGSVLAQKLIFAHTPYGDLARLFEGFLDTTTGPKKEAASYEAIARAFGLPPEQILFLSDVPTELDAARAAGMKTGLLIRPKNKPVENSAHPVYHSFKELTD